MPKEYCAFAVGRVKRTRYGLPGGESLLCPSGETKPLQAWWEAHKPEMDAAHDAEVAAWTADIDAKLAALRVETVERRVETGGLRRAKVQVDVVTFDDGEVKEYEPGKWRQEARVRLQTRHPRPKKAPELFVPWMNALEKEEIRTWEAHLYAAGGVTAIDFDPEQDWYYGLPIPFVLATVNGLSSDGWVLQHVSEDHGLYRGTDVPNEAYPARVRYLLVRDT